MQAGEAALAIQEVKDREQAAAQLVKLASDAAEQVAAQLLQEEASEAEAAQQCKDRKQKAAGKKARQKQRKQVRLGSAIGISPAGRPAIGVAAVPPMLLLSDSARYLQIGLWRLGVSARR